MHEMINHRRLNRCGGRFLCLDERELVEAAKKHWQKLQCCEDGSDSAVWHYHQYRDMAARFFLLRKRRIDDALV